MANSESFDAFYEARAPRLIRTLYLRTGDSTRAEDCAQEAFIRAWRCWHRLEHENPVAWVTTVGWHLAVRDWHRSIREARAKLSIARDPSQGARPPEELIHVQSLLSGLPPAQRDALVLHYLEDLPIRDISNILDIPEGTVKSHLSRGRENLRAVLEPRGARERRS